MQKCKNSFSSCGMTLSSNKCIRSWTKESIKLKCGISHRQLFLFIPQLQLQYLKASLDRELSSLHRFKCSANERCWNELVVNCDFIVASFASQHLQALRANLTPSLNPPSQCAAGVSASTNNSAPSMIRWEPCRSIKIPPDPNLRSFSIKSRNSTSTPNCRTSFVFTTRRLAKRGICRRRVSVCLSVSVSVTLRYCIKTAQRRITQTTPHDSPMTLVFWCQISWRNSNGITPYGGDKCRWGRLKFVTFDEKRAITRKRYKIDA